MSTMSMLLLTQLYKTEQEKELARQKMFDSMDLKSTGVITFDVWYKFSMEHILAKTAALDPTISSTTATWSSSRLS